MAAGGATAAEGAAAQPEGGLGIGGLGNILSLFGGQEQGQIPVGPNAAPGSIVGVANTLHIPGAMEKLKKILSDPEVLKAISGAGKGIGDALKSANRIPPEHAAALMQAAQGLQGPPQPQGPFLGDIPYYTPQQAQTVLQAMGIPGGMTPLAPHPRAGGY